MSCTHAVLDTNTFLHFQPIDKISWTEVLNAKEVVLVIPPVVWIELNTQKDKPESLYSELAASALKKLNSYVVRDENRIKVREGAYIEFGRYPTIDYATWSLDKDIADCQIVALAIELATKDGFDTIVVTNDGGMKGIVRTYDCIKSLSLPDSYGRKRPDSKLVKELNRLREENERLKNQTPRLKLQLPGGGAVISHKLPPVVQIDIPHEMDLIRRKFPKKKLQSYGGGDDFFNFSSMMHTNDATYNARVEEFYKEYERWLKNDLQEFYMQHSSTVSLDIELINEGTTPADEIDVLLTASGPFDILDDLLDKPEPPEPSLSDLYFDGAVLLERPNFPDPSSLFRQSWSWDIHRHANVQGANSFQAKISVQQLKHHKSHQIDPLYFVFFRDDMPDGINIQYEVHANNLRSPLTGQLRLNLSV